MKLLSFVKMEGAGNDYVYVDATRQDLDLDNASELARIIADRHFGVGGDGLIVLAPSEIADCRMLMWNADGSRGAMCGNGLRCLGKLAHDLGVVDGLALTIETDVGVREVQLLQDVTGRVNGASVDMGADVRVLVEPVVANVAGGAWNYHPGDAGNPHAVIFVDEHPDRVPVAEVGRAFQGLPAFPSGVNVEFVQARRDGGINQRTFERGTGETLACGSGATVAALAAVLTDRVPGPSVPVYLRGGTLVIHRRASSLVMEGPARTVFAGEFTLPNS